MPQELVKPRDQTDHVGLGSGALSSYYIVGKVRPSSSWSSLVFQLRSLAWDPVLQRLCNAGHSGIPSHQWAVPLLVMELAMFGDCW